MALHACNNVCNHFNNKDFLNVLQTLSFKNACCATNSTSQDIKMCILHLIVHCFTRFRCAENHTSQDHFWCVMVCYRTCTPQKQSLFYMHVLRVRAFFHETVRVCHVYWNFKLGFRCWITVIFGTLKDGSLLINTLASKIWFSYRNMFQNGVDALSKRVDAFLSKSSKLYLVWIIRKCSNFARMWHKHLLRNYKWHFRLPMSAFATAISNTLSKHQLFTLNSAFKLFHVSIAIDNCRSQKYHL